MWQKIIDGAKETAGYFVDELKLIFTDAGVHPRQSTPVLSYESEGSGC